MYYVTMTDKVMSGWGHADKKINKLIFECETYDEAEIVEENARNRGDQKNINICRQKPYYSPSKYYPQTKTKEEYPAWYVKGNFKRE